MMVDADSLDDAKEEGAMMGCTLTAANINAEFVATVNAYTAGKKQGKCEATTLGKFEKLIACESLMTAANMPGQTHSYLKSLLGKASCLKHQDDKKGAFIAYGAAVKKAKADELGLLKDDPQVGGLTWGNYKALGKAIGSSPSPCKLTIGKAAGKAAEQAIIDNASLTTFEEVKAACEAAKAAAK